MESNIASLLTVLNNNTQLLKTLVIDPKVPGDQKGFISQRIEANEATIRTFMVKKESGAAHA